MRTAYARWTALLLLCLVPLGTGVIVLKAIGTSPVTQSLVARVAVGNESPRTYYMDWQSPDGTVRGGCWIEPQCRRLVYYAVPPGSTGNDLNYLGPVQIRMWTALLGDVNLDGIVDTSDLLAVQEAFGATDQPALDLDGGGVVDQGDIAVVSAHFGQSQTVWLILPDGYDVSGLQRLEAAPDPVPTSQPAATQPAP